MNTPKKLLFGASLLVSTACSSTDAQEAAPLSEQAQMDQDLAETAARQPVQAVQDTCAQEYKDCIGPVDTALAKAALDFAAHNRAVEKTSAVKRPFYNHAAKEVYRNASDEWDKQTLRCKQDLKSCLE